MKFRILFIKYFPRFGDYESLKFEIFNVEKNVHDCDVRVDISRSFCSHLTNEEIIKTGFYAIISLIEGKIPKTGFREFNKNIVYVSSTWSPKIDEKREDLLLNINSSIEFESEKKKLGFPLN